MHCIGVIPARYHSSRFPGKPLADIAGSPMIQWVYERASDAKSLEQVIVATDHEEIRSAVETFGGEAVMTSPDHSSGTDRVAEVIRPIETDLVVNIQGDEPLIDPGAIDAAVAPLTHHPDRNMGTLACPMPSVEMIRDTNVVKVVFDRDQRALYFSRSPIPFVRHHADDDRLQKVYWQHIGLYVYRRDFLLKFTSYPPTRLEQLESLEQLRALEYGHTIHVEKSDYRSIAVDTPADLKQIQNQLAHMGKE